jgi:hypothetical protein
MAAATLCLFVQTLHVSSVRAEDKDVTTQAGVGLSGALALIVDVPVKAVSCGATAVLGGIGHGLTLGHSEFIQQEFLNGLPALCSAQVDTGLVRTTGSQPGELMLMK